MTYPSSGGRLLSPVDLTRLDRYRQLIASPGLGHPLLPPLSRVAQQSLPIPSADASESSTPIPDTALGLATMQDPLSVGADRRPTHLLTAAYRPPSPASALNVGRLHMGATPAGVLNRAAIQGLHEIWTRLNSALAPYARSSPGLWQFNPLAAIEPEMAPGFAPPAFMPIPLPFPNGRFGESPGGTDTAQMPKPLLPGRPPLPPMPGAATPDRAPPPAPANVPHPVSGPPPTPIRPAPLTGPDLFAKDFVDFILEKSGIQEKSGRRGNDATKRANNIIVKACLEVAKERYSEFEHFGGATENGDGVKDVKEYYIPGEPEKDGDPRRAKGSSYTDTAFRLKGLDNRTAQIQTVTTRRDGNLTANELKRDNNLLRNLEQTEADAIARRFTVRKMKPDEDEYTYRQMARDACNQALDSLLKAKERAEESKKSAR